MIFKRSICSLRGIRRVAHAERIGTPAVPAAGPVARPIARRRFLDGRRPSRPMTAILARSGAVCVLLDGRRAAARHQGAHLGGRPARPGPDLAPARLRASAAHQSSAVRQRV